MKNLLYILLLILLSTKTQAQITGDNYPVQAHVFVSGAGSLKLSDYFTSSTKLGVDLILKDLTKSSLDVYLAWEIEGLGLGIQAGSSPGFVPGSFISLNRGSVRKLNGIDLRAYFQPGVVVAAGVSEAAIFSGSLPEGFYVLRVRAYEAGTGREVSNRAETYFSVAYALPPVLNQPLSGSEQTVTRPQNVLLQWTPRHTSTGSNLVTYQIKVCEVAENDEPNVAILGSQTCFTVPQQTATTYLLKASDRPTLKPGKRYAWQVQATDINEALEFQNLGFSEVAWFRYGKACTAPEELKATEIGPNRVNLSWKADPQAMGYKVYYKNESAAEWQTQTTFGTSISLNGLDKKGPYSFKISTLCDIDNESPTSPEETWEAEEIDTELQKLIDAVLHPLDQISSSTTPTASPKTDNVNTSGLPTSQAATEPLPTSIADLIPTDPNKIPCKSQVRGFVNCSVTQDPVTLGGSDPLTTFNIGDPLTIYDMLAIVTEINSREPYSGKALVKLPMLNDVMMAVEFSNVEIKSSKPATPKGGCVTSVPANGFFRARTGLSREELKAEEVALIDQIRKAQDPGSTYTTFGQQISQYDQTSKEIADATASGQSLSTEQKEALLAQTIGLNSQMTNWLENADEMIGGTTAGDDILAQIQALIDQLTANQAAIEAGTSFPSVPNIGSTITGITDQIKALLNAPPTDTPRIQNLQATKITDKSATLSWQGDKRFTKYIVTIQKPGEGERIFEVSGEKLEVENLTNASEYIYSVVGYVGEEKTDKSLQQIFSTLDNIFPKPKNIVSSKLSETSIKLTWDKDSKHLKYKLKYTDKEGNERFAYPTSNEVTLADLNPDMDYPFELFAIGAANQTASELGQFSTEIKCELTVKASSYSVVAGEIVTITATCKGEITWSQTIGVSYPTPGRKDVSILTVNPTESSIYTAICTSTFDNKTNICKTQIPIELIPSHCSNFIISTNKNEIELGEEIILNASGCESVYWPEFDRYGLTLKIRPTENGSYSAKCIDNQCQASSVEILIKCDIIFSVSSDIRNTDIWNIPLNRKICINAFTPVAGNLNITSQGDAKIENQFRGKLCLEKVKEDIVFNANVTSLITGLEICQKEIKISKPINKCNDGEQDFKIGSIINSENKLVLGTAYCGEGNLVDWEYGTFKSAGKNLVLDIPNSRITFKATCRRSGCETYYTYEPESIDFKIYRITTTSNTNILNNPFAGNGDYPLTLSTSACEGTVQWIINPVNIDTYVKNYTIGYNSFKDLIVPNPQDQEVTYTASCIQEGRTTMVSKVDVFPKNNECLSFKNNKLIGIEKNKPFQLEVNGCDGAVNWYLDNQLLATGNVLNHTFELLEERKSATFKAICSDNPTCEVSKTIQIINCQDFKIEGLLQNYPEGESVRYGAQGCISNKVLWTISVPNQATYQEDGISISLYKYITGTKLKLECLGTNCIVNAELKSKPCEVWLKTNINGNEIGIGDHIEIKQVDINSTRNYCYGDIIWEDSFVSDKLKVSPVETTTYTAMCKNTGCTGSITINVKPNIPEKIECEPLVMKSIPETSDPSVEKEFKISVSGCPTGGVLKWFDENDSEILNQSNKNEYIVKLIGNKTHTYKTSCKISGKPTTSGEIEIKPMMPFEASISPNKYDCSQGTRIHLIASGCQGGTIKWKWLENNIQKNYTCPSNTECSFFSELLNTQASFEATCSKAGFVDNIKKFAIESDRSKCSKSAVRLTLKSSSNSNYASAGELVTAEVSGCPNGFTYLVNNLTNEPEYIIYGNKSKKILMTGNISYTAFCYNECQEFCSKSTAEKTVQQTSECNVKNITYDIGCEEAGLGSGNPAPSKELPTGIWVGDFGCTSVSWKLFTSVSYIPKGVSTLENPIFLTPGWYVGTCQNKQNCVINLKVNKNCSQGRINEGQNTFNSVKDFIKDQMTSEESNSVIACEPMPFDELMGQYSSNILCDIVKVQTTNTPLTNEKVLVLLNALEKAIKTNSAFSPEFTIKNKEAIAQALVSNPNDCKIARELLAENFGTDLASISNFNTKIIDSYRDILTEVLGIRKIQDGSKLDDAYTCNIENQLINFLGQTVFLGYDGQPIDIGDGIPVSFFGSKQDGHEGQIASFRKGGNLFTALYYSDDFSFYAYGYPKTYKSSGANYLKEEIIRFGESAPTNASPTLLLTNENGYYEITNGLESKIALSQSKIPVQSECFTLKKPNCDFNSDISQIIDEYSAIKTYSQTSKVRIYEIYATLNSVKVTSIPAFEWVSCDHLKTNALFVNSFKEYLLKRDTEVTRILTLDCNTWTQEELNLLVKEDLFVASSECKAKLITKIANRTFGWNCTELSGCEATVIEILKSGFNRPPEFLTELKKAGSIKAIENGLDDVAGEDNYTKATKILLDLCKAAYPDTYKNPLKRKATIVLGRLNLGDFPTDSYNYSKLDDGFVLNEATVSSGKIEFLEPTITYYLDGNNVPQSRVIKADEAGAHRYGEADVPELDIYDPVAISFTDRLSFLNDVGGSSTLPSGVVPAFYLAYLKRKQQTELYEKTAINTAIVASYAIGIGELATAIRLGATARAIIAITDIGSGAFTNVTSEPEFIQFLKVNYGKTDAEAIEIQENCQKFGLITQLAAGGASLKYSMTSKAANEALDALDDYARIANATAKTKQTNAIVKAWIEKHLEKFGKRVRVLVGAKSVPIVYKNIPLEIFSNTFTATVEQYKKTYELWGLNKWDELYRYFIDNNLNKWDGVIWPPFNGAKSIFKVERGNQLAGKIFDRFQDSENLGGGFASPVLKSSEEEVINLDLVFTYDSRALASRIQDGKHYIKFKMKNDLPTDLEFEYGKTIPWFNLQGNADQVKSSAKLQDLFNQGHIEIIEILKRVDDKWVKIK